MAVSKFSCGLPDRYRRIGNPQDMEAALKYYLSAIAAIPEEHPDLPMLQRNLAICYAGRYRGIGNMRDSEAALQFKLLAVAVTPELYFTLPLVSYRTPIRLRSDS
jgi:hypothetical protein